MIELDLQYFGGRGSAGGKRPSENEITSRERETEISAKISPSGILPDSIVASSENEARELFNKVNNPDEGFGYRIKSLGYKGYELVRTRDGKDVPKSFAERKKVFFYKHKDGTYGIRD